MLFLPNGNQIAYKRVSGSRGSVIFLGGFASNMQGAKATALFEYCKTNDISLVIFDYMGCGKSSKTFEECNITDWLSNSLDILDNLTTGPQIVIGSSLGGWLMLLLALKRPSRIKALFGIATAPDFTEDLIFDQLNQGQKEELDQIGSTTFIAPDGKCSYKITRNLIEDARIHLILTRDKIEIDKKLILLHGMNDVDVPYEYSTRIANKITSQDVELHLIKSGTHGLSDAGSLESIFIILEKLIFTSCDV